MIRRLSGMEDPFIIRDSAWVSQHRTWRLNAAGLDSSPPFSPAPQNPRRLDVGTVLARPGTFSPTGGRPIVQPPGEFLRTVRSQLTML